MNSLALSTLRYIQIAAEARDRAAPFRTFFDNLFAYRVRGPLLRGTGAPLWLNAPCPVRDREALMRTHFVSTNAALVLAGRKEETLVRDHAIAVAALRDLLLTIRPQTVEQTDDLMRRFYRLGVITRSEDLRLNAAGLRAKMPAGWTTEDDVFARYEAVAISGQQLGAHS